MSKNPGDPNLVQDATNAGNAAAQAAVVQADNGEDWTAAAIESARIGNPPPVGTFNVTINSAGQVDFGFNAGFVNNEPLVYEGPAAGYAGIIGMTPGDTYYVSLPDRTGQPRPRPVPRRQWQPRAGFARLRNDDVRDVRTPTNDNVSVSSNELTFNDPSDPTTPFDPGFATGDSFTYLGPVSPPDDAEISSLVSGTVYYVIMTSTPGIIELASSYQNAETGDFIPISLPSGSTTTNIDYSVPFTPADTRTPGRYPVRGHRHLDHVVHTAVHGLAHHPDSPGHGRRQHQCDA